MSKEQEEATRIVVAIQKILYAKRFDSTIGEESLQVAHLLCDEIEQCTHSMEVVESALGKGEPNKFCYEYWQGVRRHLYDMKNQLQLK